MRILLLVHGFPPAASGGTELYAAAQALEFRSRHADDVLVVAREGDAARPERATRHESRNGYEICWINNTWRDVTSFEQSYADDAIAALVVRAAVDFAPDIVHVHHLTGLSTRAVSALASLGIPLVATLHDYWLLCHRGQLLDRRLRPCVDPDTCVTCVEPLVAAPSGLRAGAPLARRLGALLPSPVAGSVLDFARRGAAALSPGTASADLQRARSAHMREVCSHIALFLAPSSAVRDRFSGVVPPEKLRIWPYGIDQSQAPPPRTSRAGQPLRAGFVGTMMVSKAPHLLIEAAAQLPAGSIAVDLVGQATPYHGDDSYAARLRPLVSLPFVRTHGALPHAGVTEVLSTIDVLVVPSIWPENSPFVVHEARAAGVVPVAARIGGLPELIRDNEDGLLFEPGDTMDLARVLRRLVDEPGLLDRLRAARTTPRTLRDDVAETRGLYARLITARHPTGTEHRASVDRDVVHAVVLDYRTPDESLLAVRSVLAMQPRPAVIHVVDNGGDPARMAGLRAVHSSVRVTSLPENRGYAGGMNIGIDVALAAGATHVLLLNSDVVLPPDCLGRLLGALRSDPAAGITAPVLVSRGQPDLVDNAGLSWHARTGRMRMRERGAPFAAGLPARLAGRVDAVSGCVMLVRREVFQRVGRLDPSFFFGFEDLDFCLRADAAGLHTVLADAVAYHEGGGTLPGWSTDRLYYATRNHLRLASRVGPSRAGPRLVRYASVLALNVAHACRTRPPRLISRLTAVAHGAVDALRNRPGPRR